MFTAQMCVQIQNMVISEYIDTRTVWHEELDEHHEEMVAEDVFMSQGEILAKITQKYFYFR